MTANQYWVWIIVDATGLSLAALARKTSCSTSAWSRYLNGQVLAPRDVVVALAGLAGADEASLTALWELAESARSRRDATAPPAEPVRAGQTGPDGDDRPAPAEPSPDGADRPRSRTRALAVTAGATVLAVGGLTVASVLTSPGHGHTSSPGLSPPAASVRCHGGDCTAAALGCDRDAVTTAAIRIGHAYLEARSSPACKAAWAQLTGGHRYDRIEFTAGPEIRTVKAKIRAGSSEVTPIVAVAGPGVGIACAYLTTGARQCTRHPPGESPDSTASACRTGPDRRVRRWCGPVPRRCRRATR
jgi:transcriptional regulator with XRE-family HTH domain